MTDYAGAIWLPNSNFFANRDGEKPRWVILHGTAGGTSAEAIGAYFKSTEGGNNPVSSHYIIGQDGHIVQTVREFDGAWANGVVTAGHDPWWSDSDNPNPNNVTISIEHCKPDSANATALTSAQQASSFALIKDICQRNNIPMRAADANGGVTGHYSIDPVNRSRCPGAYNWQDLWNYLNSGQEEAIMIDLSTPGVGNYFEGNDTAWRCKQNGYIIDHAGLDFYRKFGNSGLCGLTHLGLPISLAIGGIPGKPGVVYQRFERGVLVYDVNRVIDSPPGANGPVYLAHIDTGLGEDPRITQLQNQVAQLQQSTLAQELQKEHAKIVQIKQIVSP